VAWQSCCGGFARTAWHNGLGRTEAFAQALLDRSVNARDPSQSFGDNAVHGDDRENCGSPLKCHAHAHAKHTDFRRRLNKAFRC
jgi:hypothetical protein